MSPPDLQVDPSDRAAVDDLLTEIEHAVDAGFLYDMECALSLAAAARDSGESLQT